MVLFQVEAFPVAVVPYRVVEEAYLELVEAETLNVAMVPYRDAEEPCRIAVAVTMGTPVVVASVERNQGAEAAKSEPPRWI